MKDGTLMACEIIMDRYLMVMTESKCPMQDIYKDMIVNAYADIMAEKERRFLGLSSAIKDVPTSFGEESLVPPIALK